MKKIAAIELYAGIGDCVHIEPVLRHTLASGYDEIHIFYRQDAVGIYKEYPNVYDHPLEAKQLKMKLCRDGAVHVSVGDAEHNIPSLHRAFQYAQKICPAMGMPPLVGEWPPPPSIPVSRQEREWGKRYFRAVEGQRKVLFQIDSYRTSKSLTVEKARDILASIEGASVAIICKNFMQFRNDGIRHVRGLTVRELMAVASGADVTLAMDSSPGWLSLAVGTRTVILFGATSPHLYGYETGRLQMLVGGTSRCVCCNRNQCQHRSCLSAIETDWIAAVISSEKNEAIQVKSKPEKIQYPSAP